MSGGIGYHPAVPRVNATLPRAHRQIHVKVLISMEPVEIVEVKIPKVTCQGDGGALGHPRIYLNMGDEREIDCPYCGRRFRLNEDAKPALDGH